MKIQPTACCAFTAGLRAACSGLFNSVAKTLLLILATGSITASAGDPTACVVLTVRPPVGSSVIFADGFELGDSLTWSESAQTLSATEILDVVFEVEIEGSIQGDHLLALMVRTQEGHLYQTLMAPVTVDPLRDGVPVEVIGYPYPMRLNGLQLDERSGDSVMVTVMRFPVAGTTIVSSSLYGSWTVEPFLDGRPAACDVATRFSLVQ